MKVRTYLVVGGLIGVSSVGPMLAESSFAKDEEAKALAGIRARIEKIKQRLDAMESQKTTLTAQLSNIEQRYGKMARALRRLEHQATEQAKRLAEVKRQRDRSAEAIRQHRNSLSGLVRAAHAMGRQERVKLILNQENPVQASRILAYYNYLNKAKIAQIRKVHKDLKSLELAEMEVQSESGRLEGLLERKKKEQEALEQVRESRIALVRQLDEKIEDRKNRLAILKEDELRLKGLVESIQEVLDDAPFKPGPAKPFKQARGQLPWPVGGVIKERFGEQRAASRSDGVLIAANEGADVHAVSRGRIAYADWFRGYGLLIIIDHGDGYMTLYAFNQSLYKYVDDWVEAGEVIAGVGFSGGRVDPGLYFEIRKHGKPEDPVTWCRKERNGRVG